MADRQWTGSTFGNGWMHKLLIRSLRIIDTRLLYCFSYVFIVPPCLLFRDSRRTAYEFYRRRLGQRPLKAAWFTYLNHCKFSEIVIDKFAMFAGKRFNVKVDGLDTFNSYARGEAGFVQMSSHIGNYEIAGYSLVSEEKTINAVVYANEKESVRQNRAVMFDRTNIRMIPIMEDMSHLYLIDTALREGNIVSFPSDRSMGGSKCLRCDFFGAPARFPQGPFSVATMRGLDVLAINVMKEKWNGYHIYVTPLEYDKQESRAGQMDKLLKGYVSELEKRLLQYPAQWFNFFDFWS